MRERTKSNLEQDPQTATDLWHPRWCLAGTCVVVAGQSGHGFGFHSSSTKRVNAAFGSALQVALWAEEGHRAGVALTSGALQEPEETREHLELLEPEEARLLARRLMECADWCERGRLEAAQAVAPHG